MKTIKTLLIIVLFSIFLIGCSEQQQKVEENINYAKESMAANEEWFQTNVFEVGERIDEFKERFSSDEYTVEEIQESVEEFDKTLEMLLDTIPDDQQEYSDMLVELRALFDESIFEKQGEVTNEEIEEWFNEYNELIVNISDYFSKEIDKVEN